MQNNFNKNNDVAKKAKKVKSADNFAITWSLTAIGISILISLTILLILNTSLIPGNVRHKFSNIITDINKTPGIALLGGKQNILLMGVDSNGGQSDPFKGTRTDTLMLISIDPFTKSVNAVSIPRDSKVFIAEDHGLDKINSAHAVGGPDLTVRTVEQTFGVKISHYIVIDRNGVKDLVGALGGVPVFVEKRMRYVDHSAGLNIDLYPGYQNLTPVEAEGYLRFRHDAIGDIGRIKRQQWFVRGLVKKMQSPEMIMKIPQIIQLASKYIRTDMNFYELSQFAAYSKSINLSDVQTATLPGKPSKYGRVSYWILDTEQCQQIIDKLIYRDGLDKKYQGLTVSVLYSRDQESNMNSIKDTLEKSGYKMVCQAITKEPHSQIIAHSDYATFADAKEIENKIPELKGAQFTISPNNYPCAKSDLTLILSGIANNQ